MACRLTVTKSLPRSTLTSNSQTQPNAWWRHQMETFFASLAICAGNSPVTGEFPSQRPVTRSFDVFFDLRLNKRLNKQWWGWWFETPTRSLWRHCNGTRRWQETHKHSPMYVHYDGHGSAFRFTGHSWGTDNPFVTGESPHPNEGTVNTEFKYFLCDQPEQVVEHIVELWGDLRRHDAHVKSTQCHEIILPKLP